MQSSILPTDVLMEARKRYSQKELAGLLSVASRTIGMWESGEIEPPEMIVPALQHILNNSEKPLPDLNIIERMDHNLKLEFCDKLRVGESLTRQLVSFQANKNMPNYRWYKYKEGFSTKLVEELIRKYDITTGKILDPFAGSGTTLFTASKLGICSDGIELLHIGQKIIGTRKILENEFTSDDFHRLKFWFNEKPWVSTTDRININSIRITSGAYPPETLVAIERYLSAMRSENAKVQEVLHFSLLCILESISFTRKDGQYLRWDYRSGRRQGKNPFNKGKILDFDTAIVAKISEIICDMESVKYPTEFFQKRRQQTPINLFTGSCLEILSSFNENTYTGIITSPPYCNRYDYTRTYALELALLGMGEQEIINLRQQMLSCTVENRAKDMLSLNSAWLGPIHVADNQELLQQILRYLDDQKLKGHLNNSGIPRMVRGYFYEMSCVIYECARILKNNAVMIMVNDNVRYAGASISVDLILSDIASKLGFDVEEIMVLPNGKGNSSQQMGVHGRDALRKCVYVWRKKA